MRIRIGHTTNHYSKVDGGYTIRVSEIYIEDGVTYLKCEIDNGGSVYEHTYTIDGYLKRIKDAG